MVALGVGSWQQTRVWRDSETLWRWGARDGSALRDLRQQPGRAVHPHGQRRAAARGRAAGPPRPGHQPGLRQLLQYARRDPGPAARGPGGRGRVPAGDAAGSRPRRRLREPGAPVRAQAAGTPRRCRCCAPRSRKSPEHPGLRTHLALTLRNEGSCRRARAASPRPRSSSGRRSHLTPDDPEIHRNLGLALWEQGRTDAAGAHLERAVALRPRDAEAERLLAQFRADPGRPPRLR